MFIDKKKEFGKMWEMVLILELGRKGGLMGEYPKGDRQSTKMYQWSVICCRIMVNGIQTRSGICSHRRMHINSLDVLTFTDVLGYLGMGWYAKWKLLYQIRLLDAHSWKLS